MAKDTKKAVEEETVDPLEQLLDDVESVARDVRESRTMSNLDLQRSFSGDFFPLLYKLGEEVLQRDMDHEARLRRLEGALGLGEMEDEEMEQWLDEEPPEGVLTPAALAETLVLAKAVADEVADTEGASDDLKRRAKLLSTVTMGALQQAAGDESDEGDEGDESDESDEGDDSDETKTETEGSDDEEEAS